jgi:hypothetical protein
MLQKVNVVVAGLKIASILSVRDSTQHAITGSVEGIQKHVQEGVCQLVVVKFETDPRFSAHVINATASGWNG